MAALPWLRGDVERSAADLGERPCEVKRGRRHLDSSDLDRGHDRESAQTRVWVRIEREPWADGRVRDPKACGGNVSRGSLSRIKGRACAESTGRLQQKRLPLGERSMTSEVSRSAPPGPPGAASSKDSSCISARRLPLARPVFFKPPRCTVCAPLPYRTFRSNASDQPRCTRCPRSFRA